MLNVLYIVNFDFRLKGQVPVIKEAWMMPLVIAVSRIRNTQTEERWDFRLIVLLGTYLNKHYFFNLFNFNSPTCMGFFFFSNNVDTLTEFLTPNMRTTDVRIFFQDKVEVRRVNEVPESKGKPRP